MSRTEDSEKLIERIFDKNEKGFYIDKPELEIEEIDDVFAGDIENTIYPYEPKKEITKENAAKRIATILVYGFLILLGIPLFYLLEDNITVQELIDITSNYSAILSGIIGSVIGYYFRSIEK